MVFQPVILHSILTDGMSTDGQTLDVTYSIHITLKAGVIKDVK